MFLHLGHKVAAPRHRRATVLVLLTLAAASTISTRVQAAALAEQAHSLRLVPANAAFYSASLRAKEQLDILLDSEAFDQFMEIPIVQMVKMQVQFQWQQAAIPQVAEVRKYIESEEGQETVALLKEMFANESFIYGGADVASAFELLMELNSLQRTARMEAITSGEDANDVTGEKFMELLEERAEKFTVPSMVFGWRIEDTDRARRKLDEVHSLVRDVLDQHYEELSDELRREQIAGHEFLTMRLDGSMIPWDQLREKADEDDLALIERWQPIISEKKFVIALGVADEFVVLSVGESTDHLENFGENEAMESQQALERLAKHADERITSIAYMSKEFAQSLSSPERTIEDVVGAAEEVLTAAEVESEDRAALVEDIRGLANQFRKYIPEPGELASIAFLTDRGYEGFQYQTATRPTADSSKPLTILEHLGGSPALGVASRVKDNPEDYDAMVSWLKRIGERVERIAESKAEEDDWAQYQKVREQALGLLRRFDRATREHLIPALEDGQSALVLDTAAESKRWFEKLPESPKSLPMLELAIVASVSDADELREAMAEYYDIVGDAIALMRELDSEEVADFELPEPEKRQLEGGGTMYVYSFPEEWGVDDGIALNAGLSSSVAVISTSPATTERLLRERKLDVDTSLDLNRPAAVVAYVEMAKFIDAVRPWIDYGFDVAIGKLKVEEDGEESDDESDADEPAATPSPAMLQAGFFIPQLQQFLDVVSALKSASMVTYEEDGVWVTHSEMRFEDLE